MGWLLIENEELRTLGIYDRYSKDILRDPFYRSLERNRWFLFVLASWVIFYSGGFAAALMLGDSAAQAHQFGASVLVWGVFVRTVLVWHITWSVNSVTHRWGYRNYATDEGSRNNFLVGIISNGEGWHNNHHAAPRSAKHGHRWWELDVTYLTIRLLALMGLARACDLGRSRTRLRAARASTTSTPGCSTSTTRSIRTTSISGSRSTCASATTSRTSSRSATRRRSGCRRTTTSATAPRCAG